MIFDFEIIIDNPMNGFSHMTGKDLSKLHGFARDLGIKHCWFENKRNKNMPHYDVKEEYFQRAIDAGAVLVTRANFIHYIKRFHHKPTQYEINS